MGDLGLIGLTTARAREKPPPSPIYYSLRCSALPTPKWLFVPGLPKWSPEIVLVWTPKTLGHHNFSPWPLLGRVLNQCCSSPQKLSNAMSHSFIAHRGRVYSRLFVVGSQTANLTPGPSFVHNLGCKCPNDSCEAISDIYTSRPFQWYQAHPNARCFNPYNQALSFQESRRTPSPQLWECEFHPHSWPKLGCDI
jgi:hypothetical protein